MIANKIVAGFGYQRSKLAQECGGTPLNGFFISYWILPSALTVSRSRQIAGLGTYRRGRLVKDVPIDPAEMVGKIRQR